MFDDLPVDVFRRIAGFSTSSRSILELCKLSEDSKNYVHREVKKLSKKGPIRIDLHKFFSESNPFQWEFYEFENQQHKKQLHAKIRELARLLEDILEIGCKFELVNVNAASLGFQAETDEQHLPRAPFMLQKKLMHILKRFESPSVAISPVFMRPSRVIRTFRDRFDQITTLDLGTMKSLAACQLRSTVFPALVNLENFTWNHANHLILHKIPNKDRLKSLHLTFHVIGRPNWQEFMFLKEFENLETFYTGFTVPHKPTRMEMDILLNLYQAIWSRKFGNLLESFPKIREIGFWNSPEKIFQHLSKRAIPVENLNFGALNQSMSMLCSFDSIMQSFFKFEELENAVPPPTIRNLNMNLHAMPVGLDYYLPNLMCRINQLPTLESVSLLFKCIFHAQMTSSWSLETKKEKSSRRRPVIEANYTKFELHSEGLCGLLDLDRQLPPSLESCSISLNLPSDSGRKVIQSVLDFIVKLGSLNDFPELVEFHIQILGVQCFEQLVHTIGENLGPHLHRVSIYAPPKCVEKPAAKRLMTTISELFPRATEISLSTDFLKIIVKESVRSSPQWPEEIRKVARRAGFKLEQCKVTTGRLPRGSQLVCKGDEPKDIKEEEVDDVKEEEVEENDVEFLEDDDWIVDDDGDEIHDDDEKENTEIVYESEEDELDGLERKLSKESDRRHKKWEKKRKVVISDDEENSDDEFGEETFEHDIVDWEKIGEMDDNDDDQFIGHGLIDNEAVEDNGDEEEIDEEEPEDLEDLADSDDERLFENGPSRKRQIEQQQKNAKRRKIIVSDDEDD